MHGIYLSIRYQKSCRVSHITNPVNAQWGSITTKLDKFRYNLALILFSPIFALEISIVCIKMEYP